LFPRSACESVPWFSRDLGANLDVSATKHLIYDRSQKLFWVASDNVQVRDWVVNVSLGRIRGSGPSDGFFRLVLSLS
jgi:hypothetical protein